MTNTLAYCENHTLRTKKFYNIGARGTPIENWDKIWANFIKILTRVSTRLWPPLGATTISITTLRITALSITINKKRH